MTWRPACSREALRERGRLLAQVRAFFARRDVLEVQTPALGRHGVTDPQIASIETADPRQGKQPHWLQTSPEFFLKRLLAAGSGPIYQLGPAFRAGERGPRHNPEFTLLEWYRPGFDDRRLMGEVADLVQAILDCPEPETRSYQDLFQEQLGVDPFAASTMELTARAEALAGRALPDLDRDQALDLMMAQAIEPALESRGPVFVTDYPASQAALARTETVHGQTRARRFELYLGGLELCNGFHELGDATEQRRRFEADNARRRAQGLPEMPVDERLLAALEAGLPDCAGVALGVDRLLMLRLGASDISEVLPFPVELA